MTNPTPRALWTAFSEEGLKVLIRGSCGICRSPLFYQMYEQGALIDTSCECTAYPSGDFYSREIQGISWQELAERWHNVPDSEGKRKIDERIDQTHD